VQGAIPEAPKQQLYRRKHGTTRWELNVAFFYLCNAVNDASFLVSDPQPYEPESIPVIREDPLRPQF